MFRIEETIVVKSNSEKLIQREIEIMKKDRERNDYRNQEPFRTKRMLEENLKLIKEKGFEPGKEVWLTLIKMKGEMVEIREKNEINSVVVREDGEKFGYSPREMEPVE